jgi:hypothetical protein
MFSLCSRTCWFKGSKGLWSTVRPRDNPCVRAYFSITLKIIFSWSCNSHLRTVRVGNILLLSVDHRQEWCRRRSYKYSKVSRADTKQLVSWMALPSRDVRILKGAPTGPRCSIHHTVHTETWATTSSDAGVTKINLSIFRVAGNMQRVRVDAHKLM